MKRLMIFLIIALFAVASVAGVKYIAVVETDIDEQSGASATLTSADARLVTAELRREAVKNLPRDKYNIMTSETVQSMGGAVLEECAEENCVIALGSKIGADYIVRGTISKFQTKFTLTVEIYETDNGTLMASSDPVRSENVADMLEAAAAACADMYRTFANAQNPTASVPVPAPKPEPAAKKSAKPKPPKPPKTQPAATVDVSEDAKTISAAMDLARSAVYFGAANPAFVNEERCMSARYLFAGALESFYTHEAGFTMPLGLYDAAGLSWVMDGAPYYEATDESGNPTGGKVVDQEHFITLTYARNVWASLTVGGGVDIIAQNVPHISAGGNAANAMRFGFGADVGLAYKVSSRYIFGLSMNNIFNMILDTDEKYPAALRFSFLSDFWDRRVSYGADFVLKDILAGVDDYQPSSAPVVPWEFSHKLGVGILRFLKVYGLIGLSNEGIDDYGFALGARTPGFSYVRGIEGMLQFVSIINPSSNNAEAANASCVTFFVRVELGKHRNEVFADR